jgi:hypothetical protein
MENIERKNFILFFLHLFLPKGKKVKIPFPDGGYKFSGNA